MHVGCYWWRATPSCASVTTLTRKGRGRCSREWLVRPPLPCERYDTPSTQAARGRESNVHVKVSGVRCAGPQRSPTPSGLSPWRAERL